MPIWEFECERCGRFEDFLTKLPKSGRRRCPRCRKWAGWTPSLVAVRPDDMWMGKETDHGYFTSRSRYDRQMRSEGRERITSLSDLEAMHKMADEGKASKKKKQAAKRRQILEDVFRGVDFKPPKKKRRAYAG